MSNKSIAIFGAGKLGRKALAAYGTKRVALFCDNNSQLQGTHIDGKPVIGFRQLLECADNYEVIVALGKYKDIYQVGNQLKMHHIDFRYYEENEDNNKASDKVFSDIYRNKEWGGEGEFFSGSGSHTEHIITPYIDLLTNLIIDNKIRKIVEIGCGDFYVMQKVLANMRTEDISYIGIDIVKDLIEYNQRNFSRDTIQFTCMDASSEDTILPIGDMLIIRQVMQHLNNNAIRTIMEKSNKFHYVLVTEHIYEGEDAVYNLDKPVNSGIRLMKKSGVYIEEEPYSYKNMVHLLRVRENGGIIRTSLIINNKNSVAS